MPAIRDNLKTLRKSRGMTQDEVAAAVHVTRQTISSYESGRTQPDIDTLRKLAEVYQASLDDILYGGNQVQRQIKTRRRLAVIIAAGFLLGILLHGASLWVMNRFFPIGSVTVFSEDFEQRVSTRWTLILISNASAGIGSNVFYLGSTILLCLIAVQKNPPKFSDALKYTLALAVAGFLAALPWSIGDKIYSSFDHFMPFLRILPGMTFGLLVFGIILLVKRRRNR